MGRFAVWSTLRGGEQIPSGRGGGTYCARHPHYQGMTRAFGLTQQEVSDRAGLLEPALAHIEAGSKPRKAT
jgi:hypothetical protein